MHRLEESSHQGSNGSGERNAHDRGIVLQGSRGWARRRRSRCRTGSVVRGSDGETTAVVVFILAAVVRVNNGGDADIVVCTLVHIGGNVGVDRSKSGIDISNQEPMECLRSSVISSQRKPTCSWRQTGSDCPRPSRTPPCRQRCPRWRR